MSRLLSLSGEYVGTKYTFFHVTAYDPITGLYIGLGHPPESGRSLVGLKPFSCVGCRYPNKDDGFYKLRFEKNKLLGPIIKQGYYGVAGVMRGKLRGAMCETGAARLGRAFIVTDTVDAETLKEAGIIRNLPDVFSLADTIGQKTTAIPIEITALRSKGGNGFAFTGYTGMAGMSGAPIIQDGRIVGALYGIARTGEYGVGRDIGPTVESLLGGVEIGMGRGHGSYWNGAGRRGSGKHYSRTVTDRNWKDKMFRGQYGSFSGRVQSAKAMYRALEAEAPKIAMLESRVKRYEAGEISQGMLYNGHKLTYIEALKRIWAYQQARVQLAIHSYVFAGHITERQYRTIVGMKLCEL